METIPGDDRLIVFTRYPEAGTTKTRLIPTLGAEGAAALQQRLTEATMVAVAALARLQPLAVELWYAGGSHGAMTAWLGNGYTYCHQGAGDLGQRLARACVAAFDAKVQRLVIIGTDCPGLSVVILARAFAALKGADLVLGPAADGGYYLIGMTGPATTLFADIPWGGSAVRAVTLEKARMLGLATVQLELLHDIDRPADLARLQHLPER